MPVPIPSGENISVQKRHLPADYSMPYMQILQEHYNIGFTISGDRKTVTPTETYEYHAGYVSLASPLMYHRTFSTSDTPYLSILIKFTYAYIEPLLHVIGKNIFDSLYAQHVFKFSPETTGKVQSMFEDIWAEYNKSTPYKELILQGMLFRLFTTIIEEHLEYTDLHKSNSPLSAPVIDIICFLETHYSDNPTLSQMSKMFNISEGHLSRLFHAQLGIPFSRYLNNVKIGHVQTMLLKTQKSISEIALETGYCNGDYLSANFKKRTGMTPGEFRKKARREKAK